MMPSDAQLIGTASTGTTAAPEPGGVLVLDATGRVVASNLSARKMWAAETRLLVGLSLARLFGEPGETSNGDEVFFKAFRASALDRWAGVTIRPLTGDSFAMRARLERAAGGAGSYIVTFYR
jgi:hypothetical protein